MGEALGYAAGQAHDIAKGFEQQRTVPPGTNAQAQQVPHAQDEGLGLLLHGCCGCRVLLRKPRLGMAGAAQAYRHKRRQRLQQQPNTVPQRRLVTGVQPGSCWWGPHAAQLVLAAMITLLCLPQHTV